MYFLYFFKKEIERVIEEVCLFISLFAVQGICWSFHLLYSFLSCTKNQERERDRY